MKKVITILITFALLLPLCGCGASRSAEAARRAQDLLTVEPWSRTGLIDRLQQDGFSSMDAVTAVDSLGADWTQQAARYAGDLIGKNFFISFEEIEASLRLAGFGPEEIAYVMSAAEG